MNFLLSHRAAPGDIVVMSALVRDLRAAYGTQHSVDVRTTFPEVWVNNPYLTSLSEGPGVRLVELTYGAGIKRASRGEKSHFLTEFHRDFAEKTGIQVPVTLPRPDLHLEGSERSPLVSGRYWVVVNGGKQDCTIKPWSYTRMQQVVTTLRGWGLRFVQAGATHRGHYHPTLEGALNLVGRTNLRDFFSLIYRSEGVICGVTGAMHIAAAFEKPCVVLAGGREEPWWESYTNAYGQFGPVAPPVRIEHRFLHTLDLLDCCRGRGCWKKKIVLEENPAEVCRYPVEEPSRQPLARCLDLITVDHVLDAVMHYYETGMLPPIGQPSGKYRQPPSAPAPEPSQNAPPTSPLAWSPFSALRLPETLSPIAPPTPTSEIAPPEALAAPLALAEPELVREPALRPRDGVAATPGLPLPTLEQAKARDWDLLDHPVLGGRVTVCVLCYGDFYDLHRRCLDSILATVPAHRIQLRVGTNEVCPATRDYLQKLPIHKLYHHAHNALKYPVMREMFHDAEDPITDNYLVWFDDDSYVVNPLWLPRLAETIIHNHQHGCRLYGIRFWHKLHTPQQAQWFRDASWYRGRHFQTTQGAASPNGDNIIFVSGGFLALGTDALRACDIPDRRLSHNGGDVTLGAQVWQGGFQVKEFNRGKELIYSSGAPRRGVSQSFPWQRS